MKSYYIIPTNNPKDNFGEVILVNSKTFDFLLQILKIEESDITSYFSKEYVSFLKNDFYSEKKSNKAFLNYLNSTFFLAENSIEFAFENYNYLLNKCKSTIHFKSTFQLFEYVKNNNIELIEIK